MRIARIIEYFPPHIGGMERHGLILSREQVKLGHQVDVFIGYGDDRSGSTRIEADQRGNGSYPRESAKNPHKSASMGIYRMPLQFLPIYSKIRRFWFNLWAYNKVKRKHRKNPYDVIHLHGDFVEAYTGGKLAKKLNVLVVLTIHGGLNPKILKKSNAKFFNLLNRIICVSEEIKNTLLSIGVHSSKISVISSGIYLDEFNGPKEAAGYSKPIIISVGNLTKQKGFDYLISAFKKIKNSAPSASLVIIGEGPETAALEKIAENTEGIYFLGVLPHDQIVIFLLGADIFVLASVTMSGYYEGAPTSIMEAMAAGLPVIATKSGGIPYLVKDGVNGILVEEKNSAMLAEAVIKLIDNENLKQKMRAKNLEDIKPKDWPLIAKQITDAYA